VFDVLVSGLGALNQVGLFIAGLVCAGLGGLFVGNAVYWRLHAVRVEGRVIGVRQGGNCFNAVYRYTLPSGQSCEGTSNEGSSSVRGKETGTLVPLLVIPEKPDQVLEARTHIFTIIGVLLFVPAAWLFYTAVTAWPIGPMTWAVAAVLMIHFTVRIYKIMLPKDKRLTPLAWKDLMSQRPGTGSKTSVRPIEDIISQPEIRARDETQRAYNRRWAPFLSLAGVGLLGLSVYLGFALVQLEASGMRAPGVVRALELSSTGSENPTYFPQVSFKTRDGIVSHFKDRVATNPPAYHPGDQVTVLYMPNAPAGAIIDHGIWNWLSSVAVFLFGALLSFAGIQLMGRRQ
jgi:hypothetical protein